MHFVGRVLVLALFGHKGLDEGVSHFAGYVEVGLVRMTRPSLDDHAIAELEI